MEQNLGWSVRFFEDDEGRCPVARWLDSLPKESRAAAVAGIQIPLARMGPDICRTELGRNLGGGIFELRIRQDAETIARKAGADVKGSGGKSSVLLRIFCHAHGDRVVLLLSGYDKGSGSGARRQNKEIELAKKRLRSFKLSEQRQKKRERRD